MKFPKLVFFGIFTALSITASATDVKIWTPMEGISVHPYIKDPTNFSKKIINKSANQI